MIAWMLYAASVGVLIAAGALALERLAASAGRPRRFVWLAALTLAVLVPLLGGRREPAPTAEFPAVAAGDPVATEPIVVRGDYGFLPPLPVPAGRTAARTAGIAWGAGSAAALTALCGVIFVVALATRRWPRRRLDGTDVYLSRRFGPALVGVLAPKPVIPTWVLKAEPDARATILRHEQEHARARDHLALLYAALVAAAFPWSPAVWWMCRRLRAAIEIDCDRRVIDGGVGAADYGAVLLQAGSRSRGRWGFAPALSQPTSLLERRLRAMNEKRGKLKASHGVLLATAGLIALAIACEMPAPTELDEALEEVMPDTQDRQESSVGPETVDLPPSERHLAILLDAYKVAYADLHAMIKSAQLLGFHRVTVVTDEADLAGEDATVLLRILPASKGEDPSRAKPPRTSSASFTIDITEDGIIGKGTTGSTGLPRSEALERALELSLMLRGMQVDHAQIWLTEGQSGPQAIIHSIGVNRRNRRAALTFLDEETRVAFEDDMKDRYTVSLQLEGVTPELAR